LVLHFSYIRDGQQNDNWHRAVTLLVQCELTCD